jgi:PAS domain S-box-containing protein
MSLTNSIAQDLKIIQLVLDQIQEILLFLDKNLKIVKKSKGAIEFISRYNSSTEKDFFEYFPELKSKELEDFCKDSTQNTFEIRAYKDFFSEEFTYSILKSDTGYLVKILEPRTPGNSEKYPNLFEKMPVGVIYEDSTGQILDANPAAQQILGLSLDQLQGKTPIDPKWHLIHMDGSPFPPRDTLPSTVSLRTGLPISNEIIGLFDPSTNCHKWIFINSTPEFRSGEQKPFRVFSTFFDITDRIETKRKLKTQNELLEVLISTSTSFINLPEEKLDETIQHSLQKLGEFVKADRMYVFDYDWVNKTCTNTFEWCAKDVEPQIEFLKEVPFEGLEAWTESHNRGEFMSVEDVSTLEKDSITRQILELQGIKSLLTMPIMDNQICFGFIGLDSVENNHVYSENEINLVKVFAGILANVKNQLESERQLKERLKELNSIYLISDLTNNSSIQEDDLLIQITEIIPTGFLIPNETSVRLTYGTKFFESPELNETSNLIQEKLIVNDQEVGSLQVFIPENKKFLAEEHTLVKAMANTLDKYLEARESLSQVRNSEEQLRNLVNTQTSYVLRTDIQGRNTYWNKKFKEEFGWIYENTPLLIANSFDSICDYHYDRVVDTIQLCLATPGEIFSVELDMLGKNGLTITTLWEYVALVDKAGKPTEIQCMGINITDRKEIQQKLIESENRLRSLLDSQTNYVIRTDLQGRHNFWNKKFEQDFGYLYSSKGMEISDSLTSVCTYDRIKVIRTVKKCLQEPGKVFQVELDKPTKTGKILATLWDFVCLKDKGGIPKEMQCVGIDITERKLIEKKLKESELRFRQIAEHSGSVIWEVDRTGLYTYINSVSKQIFGYDPEEIIGKKYFYDLFPKHQKQKYEALNFELLEKGNQLLEGENAIQRKDGKVIWVTSFGTALKNESGKIVGFRGANNDVTARKTAEEELRKFQIISDQAFFGTVIIEPETKIITYCNASFAKMHGYEADELIGKTIYSLHSADQLEDYKTKVFPEFEKYGEYHLKEFGRKRKDGSTFIGLATTKLFSNEEGSPLFIASTVIDISEQKKQEERIKDQNIRLKAIIEAIPDILFIVDKAGNYLEYYSSGLSNAIGEFNYLVGKRIADVFQPEDAALHLEKIKNAIELQRIETYEYRGITGNENRYFESRIVPMTQDKALRFVREITDRKKSELEIKKLTIAIEQSPVSIIITDLEGKLEYMSPAFLKMTGYSYDELHGKPISMIKSGLTEGKTYENLWHTISKGKTWHNEWRNRKKTGELFWESISITPIQNETNRITNFLAVKQDITERKRFEEEIIELNQTLEKKIQERTRQLERSNKELEHSRIEADAANQAKSGFLSKMSHELRTPMNSILGFAQLLEQTELDPSQKKKLDFILKSGNHLLQLINEVLNIAKIEAGEVDINLEPVELHDVIEEVSESFMPFAFTQDVSVKYPKDRQNKIYVMADLLLLKQILINLLNNAIKYNYKKGNVIIYTELVSLENSLVKKIRINIQDSGIGISKENINLLFKPFERVGHESSLIEGTGLGLSVAEKLIKLMGGEIGVNSKPGTGSTFWIELPLVEGTFEKIEERERDQVLIKSPEEDSCDGILLLVEDNLTNIELIKELLRITKPGCQLVSTTYGNETLSLAKKFKPSVIFLDLNLPDTHGSKVLEDLKTDQETKIIPVIIVTADATVTQKEELSTKGAEQFITKPISVGRIIRIFDQYLKPKTHD